MVIASKANPSNPSISAKHSYNILSYSLKDNTSLFKTLKLLYICLF